MDGSYAHWHWLVTWWDVYCPCGLSFANWAMLKGGVEIVHDGITPFTLVTMWFS